MSNFTHSLAAKVYTSQKLALPPPHSTERLKGDQYQLDPFLQKPGKKRDAFSSQRPEEGYTPADSRIKCTKEHLNFHRETKFVTSPAADKFGYFKIAQGAHVPSKPLEYTRLCDKSQFEK